MDVLEVVVVLVVSFVVVPVVVVEALVVVSVPVVEVEVEVPQSPLPDTEEDGMKTRGRPDTIGTAMFPLESTVTEVQVYISISTVPEEYPLPLRERVYELPLAP